LKRSLQNQIKYTEREERTKILKKIDIVYLLYTTGFTGGKSW